MMEGWVEGWMPFSRGAGFSGHTSTEEWRESRLESEALASVQPAHPVGVTCGHYIIFCGPSGLQDEACESEL